MQPVPHLSREDERAESSRSSQRGFARISTRTKSLFFEHRRAHELYLMPRSACRAGPRNDSLRCKMPGLSCTTNGISTAGRTTGETMQSGPARLRPLSHASGQHSQFADSLHRPPHSHCCGRRALSGLNCPSFLAIWGRFNLKMYELAPFFPSRIPKLVDKMTECTASSASQCGYCLPQRFI